MFAGSAQEFYSVHNGLSDPGPYTDAVSALGPDVAICTHAVRGLMVHWDWLPLYGLSIDEARMSRTTMPVAERLGELLERDRRPLVVARNPTDSSVGTCRDYALLLCGFLRTNGIAARVRCGFARYFSAMRWEDHWTCQFWHAGLAKWVTVDAQLDAEQQAELDIEFDTLNVPERQFLFAADAWRLVAAGAESDIRFGHGIDAGGWFMRVNLARDWLALHKQEMSDWDDWRCVPNERRALDSEARRWCDDIAERLVALAAGDDEPTNLGEEERNGLRPFWHG